MHCKNCGREIADQSKFCTFCGAELKEDNLTNQKEHHPHTSPSISQPTKQMESNTPQKKTEHKLPKQAAAILLVFLLGISAGGIVIYMTQSSKSSQLQQMKEGQSDTETMADNTEANKTLAEITPKAEQTSVVITTEATSQTERPIDTVAPAETPVINDVPKAAEPVAPEEETMVTDTEVLEPPEWKIVIEGEDLEKRVTHIREDVYKPIEEGKVKVEKETQKLNGNADEVTYYKKGSQIVKLSIKHGISRRDYYFEDGELCFGFLYTWPRGKEKDELNGEERIYFAKERIFRYINGTPDMEDRVLLDNMGETQILTLEMAAFNDIRQYMPDKKFIWENKESIKTENINSYNNRKIIVLADITDTEIEYYDTFLAGCYYYIPYGRRKKATISPEVKLYYSKTNDKDDEQILCNQEKYNEIITSYMNGDAYVNKKGKGSQKWGDDYGGYGFCVDAIFENNVVVKCEEYFNG